MTIRILHSAVTRKLKTKWTALPSSSTRTLASIQCSCVLPLGTDVLMVNRCHMFSDVNQHVASKLKSMGYIVVCWNRDSLDWSHEWSPSSTIAANVAALFSQRSSDKSFSSILLQHDSVGNSVEAQRAIIKDLKSKGYRFGNLSECLGDTPVYRDEL